MRDARDELKEAKENRSEAEIIAPLEKDKNSLLTSEIEQLRSELERAKAEVTELTNYKAEEGER